MNTPNIIGRLDFQGSKVTVYYDNSYKENGIICSWRSRNPDSFYQGIMYMDNTTGKCSYPEGAIIPTQTKEDREIIPMFIIVGREEMTGDVVESLHTYLENEHKIRNNIK